MTDFNSLAANAKRSFAFGQLVMTTNAMRTLPPEAFGTALARHAACDWGDVCPEDREANEVALVHGGRLFSVYHDNQRVKFWVITEADRSATTVLLPDDY